MGLGVALLPPQGGSLGAERRNLKRPGMGCDRGCTERVGRSGDMEEGGK